MLSQRHLRWLGHVERMEKGRLPKDLLYGQLELGKRQEGHPRRWYKDSRKRDLHSANIDVGTWEDTVAEHPS